MLILIFFPTLKIIYINIYKSSIIASIFDILYIKKYNLYCLTIYIDYYSYYSYFQKKRHKELIWVTGNKNRRM